MTKPPPQLFDRLLTWYCKQVDLEDIQGDLYEVYFRRYAVSPRKAKLLFVLDVLNLFNPLSNHRKRSTWFSEIYGFNYYHQFNISIRNLGRYPTVNAVKITGLSLAIVAFTYIYYFVGFQRSFDHFHEHKDRIFRITTTISSPDMQDKTAWANGFLKEVLTQQSEEVAQVVRMLKADRVMNVRVSDKNFIESNIYFADPHLFEVFSFELSQGNASTALSQPNAVLLTQKTALKYFGHTDVLEKLVTIDNQACKITGIINDLPENSDLQFDMVKPFPSSNIDWAYMYLLLNPNGSIENLRENLAGMVEPYLETYKSQGIELSYEFENIRNVHFSSPKLYDTPKSNKMQVLLFEVTGYLILFISLVNFLNLHTAQLIAGLKKLNIRKVIGASKTHLFLQFFVESCVCFGIAILMSLAIIMLSKNAMGGYTGFNFFETPLPFISLFFPVIALFLLLIALSVFSLIFSNRPTGSKISYLKTGRGYLRKGLVGIQLALSFGLMVSAIMIYQQLVLIQNHNPGFNKDNVLSFQLPFVSNQHINPSGLKQALRGLSTIQSVSFVSDNSVPGAYTEVDEYYVEGKDEPVLIENIAVDENFVNVLEIPVVAGRFYVTSLTNDGSLSAVVNQTFVRKMGWKNEAVAIGKRISGYGLDAKIIGVVQDFYFQSPHKVIQPMVLEYAMKGTHVLVKLTSSQKAHHIVDDIKTIWSKYLSGAPFTYSFLKSDYEKQFKREKSALKVVGTISILVVFIASFGMYAIMLMLGSFRIREMGIRKVNGAGRMEIFQLFSKEFTSVLIVSFVAITPFLWMGLDHWLSNYPLRMKPSLTVFIIVAISIGFITSGITYLQALRSYRSKTVDALKYE